MYTVCVSLAVSKARRRAAAVQRCASSRRFLGGAAPIVLSDGGARLPPHGSLRCGHRFRPTFGQYSHWASAEHSRWASTLTDQWEPVSPPTGDAWGVLWCRRMSGNRAGVGAAPAVTCLSHRSPMGSRAAARRRGGCVRLRAIVLSDGGVRREPRWGHRFRLGWYSRWASAPTGPVGAG